MQTYKTLNSQVTKRVKSCQNACIYVKSAASLVGQEVTIRFLTAISLIQNTSKCQLACESCDICYYAFQRVVFGDLFAGFGK